MGCFRCESWNGSNPECEDTFNSTAAFLKGFYEQNCMSYMKSRNGLYPATACVKIKGKISKRLHFLNITIQMQLKILSYLSSTYNVSNYETLLKAIAQPTFAISKKMGETQFDTYSTLRFGWLCTQQYNK